MTDAALERLLAYKGKTVVCYIYNGHVSRAYLCVWTGRTHEFVAMDMCDRECSRVSALFPSYSVYEKLAV